MRKMLISLSMIVLLLPAAVVNAAWHIEIESKTVAASETDVTVAFSGWWEMDLLQLEIPIIVREIDPGAFWVPPLPYDDNATDQGVTWVPPFDEYSAGVFAGLGCNPAGDVGYDGVNPDHFFILIGGIGLVSLMPSPDGEFLQIDFDVAATDGQFEFDTACFMPHLTDLLMYDTDGCGFDHGPNGINDMTFNKGVITIGDCNCGSPGDVEGDGTTSPLDVSYLVAKVYKGQDALCDYVSESCPFPNGDVDGDGAVSPVDVAYLVAKVYKSQDALCADRCSGTPGNCPGP